MYVSLAYAKQCYRLLTTCSSTISHSGVSMDAHACTGTWKSWSEAAWAIGCLPPTMAIGPAQGEHTGCGADERNVVSIVAGTSIAGYCCQLNVMMPHLHG